MLSSCLIHRHLTHSYNEGSSAVPDARRVLKYCTEAKKSEKSCLQWLAWQTAESPRGRCLLAVSLTGSSGRAGKGLTTGFMVALGIQKKASDSC